MSVAGDSDQLLSIKWEPDTEPLGPWVPSSATLDCDYAAVANCLIEAGYGMPTTFAEDFETPLSSLPVTSSYSSSGSSAQMTVEASGSSLYSFGETSPTMSNFTSETSTPPPDGYDYAPPSWHESYYGYRDSPHLLSSPDFGGVYNTGVQYIPTPSPSDYAFSPDSQVGGYEQLSQRRRSSSSTPNRYPCARNLSITVPPPPTFVFQQDSTCSYEADPTPSSSLSAFGISHDKDQYSLPSPAFEETAPSPPFKRLLGAPFAYDHQLHQPSVRRSRTWSSPMPTANSLSPYAYSYPEASSAPVSPSYEYPSCLHPVSPRQPFSHQQHQQSSPSSLPHSPPVTPRTPHTPHTPYGASSPLFSTPTSHLSFSSSRAFPSVLLPPTNSCTMPTHELDDGEIDWTMPARFRISTPSPSPKRVRNRPPRAKQSPKKKGKEKQSSIVGGLKFVNYTQFDKATIVTGVAPSGPGKRRKVETAAVA